MIVKKTEKQILSDVYFDGFSCRKKDESTLNKLWISAESLKKRINVIFTTWKLEQITCKCVECFDTKMMIRRRDELLKSLGLSEPEKKSKCSGGGSDGFLAKHQQTEPEVEE